MSKFIFLDRDGTIIKDKAYVFKPEDVELLPHAIEGLKLMQEKNYQLIMLSNQAGIARGKYGIEDAIHCNNTIVRMLKEHHITILASYFCPHHPKFTGLCTCRKPSPGLVHQAMATYGMDPRESIFIGDKDCDIELGHAFGGKTILIDNGQYPISAIPHHRANDLLTAAQCI